LDLAVVLHPIPVLISLQRYLTKIANVTLKQQTNVHQVLLDPRDRLVPVLRMAFQGRMANLVKMLNLLHLHHLHQQDVSNVHQATLVHLAMLATQVLKA